MVHVIAEAGSNHGGDKALAQALVQVAHSAGADSVKFQFIHPEGLYLPFAPSPNGRVQSPVYAQRLKEVLSQEAWKETWDYAARLGIPIASSVFDQSGIDLLMALGSPYVKIASTDLNNEPLIELVISTGSPVILSTGLSSLGEIENALALFSRHNALSRLVVMHCVSVYPCPLMDTNLRMISTLRAAFDVEVGFSDHTEGSIAACLAVALGATWIEKHFTVDKALPGFDHRYACNPEEFTRYVSDIRDAERALLPNRIKVGEAERVTALRARRGLYAKRDLSPGHVITEDDILCVRPSGPLSPQHIPLLVGKTITHSIAGGDAFDISMQPIGTTNDQWEAYRYWEKEMIVKGMKPEG